MRIRTIKKECMEFAQRLNQALDECPDAVPRIGRQRIVGKMFGVDQKGARKWLLGLGYPTLEKSIEIAERLNVATEWLLSGRGSKRVVDDQNIQLAEMLDLWYQLSPALQVELIHLAEFLREKAKMPVAFISGAGEKIKDPQKPH